MPNQPNQESSLEQRTKRFFTPAEVVFYSGVVITAVALREMRYFDNGTPIQKGSQSSNAPMIIGAALLGVAVLFKLYRLYRIWHHYDYREKKIDER